MIAVSGFKAMMFFVGVAFGILIWKVVSDKFGV